MMTSTLEIAILAGLGGMLGWGFADFFAKKTIDQIGDVTTLFWGQTIGILPLLLLFLYKPSIPHLGSVGWIYLVILGAWSGLSYIPTYVAFGKGQVSLLSPIFASYAVVVAILSAIFFGEVIPGGRMIAFAIVFLGIVLINGDPRIIISSLGGRSSERNLKGLPEILVAIFFYSFWLIALDQFVNGHYWVPYLLVIRIFSSIALFIYAKTKSIRLQVTNRKLWKYLIFIGVLDVAAFSFVTWGFSVTPYTSVIAMLSGAFSLPTIILARIFLKERNTRLQTAGSIITIAGIALLYLL